MDKRKKTDKLIITYKELAFQNEEKEKRAAELIIANKELKKAEEQFRLVVESAPNAIVLINNEGFITLVNNQTENLFGYERKELIGNKLEILIPERFSMQHPGHRNIFFKKTQTRAMGAGRDLFAMKKNGTEVQVEIGLNPIETAQGQMVLASIIDITERKIQEANLKKQIKELAFQNEEKEKRAAELSIANKELAFQNEEKEKRAAELVIANKELAFQNEEKEKRAAELIIANKELAFQNEEKEKRAAELIIANKELQAFAYVSSHDLQEPLRKIQTFATVILEKENKNLSDNGKDYFHRMQSAAGRMRQLIEDLLAYSRINTNERKFEKTDLNIIIEEVKTELKDTIQEKHAIIEVIELCPANIIPFQFGQLMHNLISNALKFSNPDIPPRIIIKSRIVKGSKSINARLNDKVGQEKLSPEKKYCHITVKDNGIGFEPHFRERIFEVFQKLHNKEVYEGTGIGLAIVKKIVENHNGIIIATSELKKGAKFDIYIPAN